MRQSQVNKISSGVVACEPAVKETEKFCRYSALEFSLILLKRAVSETVISSLC